MASRFNPLHIGPFGRSRKQSRRGRGSAVPEGTMSSSVTMSSGVRTSGRMVTSVRGPSIASLGLRVSHANMPNYGPRARSSARITSSKGVTGSTSLPAAQQSIPLDSNTFAQFQTIDEGEAQTGANPMAVRPTPQMGYTNFDNALEQLRQVHIEETALLQKQITYLQKLVNKLAKGSRMNTRASQRGQQSLGAASWDVAVASASINLDFSDTLDEKTWKTKIDKTAFANSALALERRTSPANHTASPRDQILELNQVSPEFNPLISEESTIASDPVADEPLFQTPRNGSPTILTDDPLDNPGAIIADAELTSWVRNALKTELAAEATDPDVLQADGIPRPVPQPSSMEFDDYVDSIVDAMETKPAGKSGEFKHSLHSAESKESGIDLLREESGKINLKARGPSEQMSQVEIRWRDLAMGVLSLASKELYIMKPCWVQSESFFRKAMRGAHQMLDLFEATQSIQKQDSETSAGYGYDRPNRFSVFWTDRASNKFIIDPQSPRRMIWALFGMALMIYDLVMLPMQAFELPDSWFLTAVSWMSQIFWTLDMFVSAITSYYVNGELETRISRILRTYATTWMPVDFLITFPLWLILLMGWDTAKSGNSVRSARYFRMLRFLRLMRLLKFESLWGAALDYINSASAILVIGMAKLMFLMILLNHLIACVWYAIGRSGSGDKAGWALNDSIKDADISYKYLSSIHWTLTQFQGTSDVTPGGTLAERIYAVAFLLCALFILTIFISSLTNRMMQFQNLHSQRTYEERVVRGYLSNHDISHQLSVRIKKYLEWKQRLKKSQEYDEEVFNILPLQLMMDLLDEVRGPTCCEHHQFFSAFREAYPRVMRRLCFEAMVPSSPMPGEQVFSPGDICIGMYFIINGHASYFTFTNKQVHLGHEDKGMSYAPAGSKRMRSVTSNSRSGLQKTGDATMRSVSPRNRRANMEELATLGLIDIKPVTRGNFLSEPILWTFWNHVGQLDIASDAMLLVLQPARFEEVVTESVQAQASAVLYARRFVGSLNSFGKHYTDFIDQAQLQDMIHSHNEEVSSSDEEDEEDEEDYETDEGNMHYTSSDEDDRRFSSAN